MEIIKRSKSLLQFITQHEALTDIHVRLLWKAAMTQLRSNKKVVLDLLLSLCPDFSPDLLDMVMVLVTQVTVSEYDDVLGLFIQKLVCIAAKNAIDAESGAKKSLGSLVGVGATKSKRGNQGGADVFSKIVKLGLSLLWGAIEEKSAHALKDEQSNTSSGSSLSLESVFAEAINQVHQLWSAAPQSLPSAKEQLHLLHQYLANCISSIKDRKGVELAMLIIQRVAERYGNRSTNGSSSIASTTLAIARSTFQSSQTVTPTTADLLKDLDAKYGLIKSVVDELEAYLLQARRDGAHNTAIPASGSPESIPTVAP
ncbi:hypothetical protein PINS_up012785 [Pythium insidiosum]|nr:hypothetical protein PINS_up012785 [Pythium insidiosum]